MELPDCRYQQIRALAEVLADLKVQAFVSANQRLWQNYPLPYFLDMLAWLEHEFEVSGKVLLIFAEINL